MSGRTLGSSEKIKTLTRTKLRIILVKLFGIQRSFAAQVIQGGDLAIPAKLLNDIISRLPEGEITLEDQAGETVSDTDSERRIVTLTSASGRYQVRGMSSEEFPELPQIP